MKRIIGLVLVVLAIVGTVNVVRKLAQDKESQAQTQTTTNSSYESGRKFGRKSVPVVLVLLGIYGLRLLLSSDDAPRPTAPATRRSPASNLPPPGDPSLRGGQDTFASNPAVLRISVWQWLAANPRVYITAIVIGVIAMPLLFIKLPVGLVLLITAILVPYREIKMAKEKFWGGNVCPGIVLSAEQNLVAVYAELGTGNADRPYPAIQILKQPLHRMTTGRANDGMRVATAALYLGDVKEPAWRNFWPEVINCVVHDPTEIERVLGSIPDEEWQLLDACLAQIPVAKLGLHHVSPASLSAVVPEETQAAYISTESGFAPARPWYKSPVAIIAGAAVAIVAILTIGSIALVAMNRPKPPLSPFITHAPATTPPAITHPPTTSSPAVPPTAPSLPAQPATAVPGMAPGSANSSSAPQYQVGSAVEANWAGGWIPGKVTRVNPGGHSVMVQLEDARFPHPIVFSERQLRPK